MRTQGYSPAEVSGGRYRDAARPASATIVALLVLGAVTACGPHEAATIHDSAAVRDVGSLEGTSGATSRGPAGQHAESTRAVDADRAVMDSLRAQLRLMSAMNTQELTAILPAHGRMVTSLLARLTHDSPTGAHPGKDELKATIDSVRDDLARLPGMTAQQLGQAMPGHLARVQRVVRK